MDKIVYAKPHNGVIMKKRPYTGVTYNKTFKRWYAYIRVNGKAKHLGCFKTLGEALTVRQMAEKEAQNDG